VDLTHPHSKIELLCEKTERTLRSTGADIPIGAVLLAALQFRNYFIDSGFRIVTAALAL
jgi:hypothetical protein